MKKFFGNFSCGAILLLLGFFLVIFGGVYYVLNSAQKSKAEIYGEDAPVLAATFNERVTVVKKYHTFETFYIDGKLPDGKLRGYRVNQSIWGGIEEDRTYQFGGIRTGNDYTITKKEE